MAYLPEGVHLILRAVDLSYVHNPCLLPKSVNPICKVPSRLWALTEALDGQQLPLTMALTAFGPGPHSSALAFLGCVLG